MSDSNLHKKLSALKKESLVDLIVNLLSDANNYDERITQRTMDSIDSLLKFPAIYDTPSDNDHKNSKELLSIVNVKKGKVKKERPFEMSK